MLRPWIVATVLVASLALAASADAAPAGSTLLLSGPLGPVGPLAGLVNDSGYGSSLFGGESRMISSDGTKVVFASGADAMDPTADDDALGAIYVRDIPTNTTTLVSRATGANGAIANGGAGSATISADGKRVAFMSAATNLDPADTDPQFSIYVRDLTTNTTFLASRANGAGGANADDDAYQPSLSTTGRFVAFTSSATNLGGTPVNFSIYRRDLTGNTTTLASTLTDGTTRVSGSAPSISPDGSKVAFVSNDAIDTVNDTNTADDIYLGTVGTTTVVLVSRANGAAGAVGNGQSLQPSMTTAGNDKVAFLSLSTNLTAVTDLNGSTDAFVRDVGAGTTILVSRATGAGGALSDLGADAVSITGDGTGVAFTSLGTNLGAPADANTNQAYLRSGTTTTLLSRANGLTGDPGDGFVTSPSADGTGAAISFEASDTNLSTANDDDFNSVYVRRPAAGTTTFVSRPSGTSDFISGINSTSGLTSGRMVSADGRYVLYASQSDLLSGEDDNRFQNVFRFDIVTGTRVLVSRATGVTGAPANGQSTAMGISADGNRVLFVGNSATNLDPDTPPSSFVLYLRDIAAATTTIAGRRPGALGAALGDTSAGSLSGDGHHVAFVTRAAIDGADTNGTAGDVYVRDLDAGAVTLASRADGAGGAVADKSAQTPSLNFNGNRVAWSTSATNLGGFVVGKFQFLYVRDLAAGTTTLVGRTDGPNGSTVNASVPSISDDGNRVAWGSNELNITGDGADNHQHIYVRDIAAGSTILASRADGAAGAPDNPPAGALTFSNAHSLSGDGNRVMFASGNGALVADDTNGKTDVFVRDLAAGSTLAVGRFNGVDGALGPNGSFSGGLSATGHCAAFSARGPGFVANSVPGADFTQLYLRAVDASCPPDEPVVTPPTPQPVPVPAGATVDPAPVLSAFSLSARTFRVGPKATAISAATKLPVGTTMRYKASEPVTMTFTFSRRLPGRLKGKRCVKPTKALRKRRACTRLVGAGKLTRKSKTGTGSVKFSGRIGRKALKPGRYQVTARATDSAGKKSAKRTVRFTVKR
ncbi:MAG TPA: hypothetical protein VF066_01865 [Thermoleophilaceae bacterium]